jgi:dihydrolipoamide dehydrogenase
MANTIEVKVPDIGGHDNVPVIEVLVKPGDAVAKEQSLITLESDKATMEIPSSAAGTVKDVKLKVGDEVSEGAVIVVLETTAESKDEKPANAASEKMQQDVPAVSTPSPPIGGEGRGEGEAPQALAAPPPTP